MYRGSNHTGILLLFLCLAIAGILWTPLSVSASPVLPQDALPATVQGITHGAYLRPVCMVDASGIHYCYGHEIEAFNNLIGKNLGVYMYFLPWSQFDPFLSNIIRDYLPASQRPVIMLTWEPSLYSAGCNLGFGDGLGPVRSIVQGRCDAYIRGFAQALKARPQRYLLRLAHEMNITDPPWGAGRYGSTPGDYVAMWRRVHDIFAAAGVSNVEWVWSPNYASHPVETWNTLHAYYPGDEYVDWIGLSGYNWYQWGSQPWKSFTALYDAVLKDLTCRYAKPQIVAELGSVDGGAAGTSKATWITDAYAQIPTYPFVRAVLWFNDYAYGNRTQADFRVTTGSADCVSGGGCSGVQPLPGAGANATQAYIQAVSNPSYTRILPSLADATPVSTVCGGGPILAVTPRGRFIEPGGTLDVQVSAAQFDTPLVINVHAPLTFRTTLSSQPLLPRFDSAVLRLTALTDTLLGVHTVIVWLGNVQFNVEVEVLPVVHRTYAPLVRN